jgi:hypothetical protein
MLELRLASRLLPGDFHPRSDAATCGFCREHDGVWISDPGGMLVLPQAGTRVETFASGRVLFHFCVACDALAYATFDPPGSTRVAVARVALFPSIRAAGAPVVVTNFEGEVPAVAERRRRERWTPVRLP